VVKLYKSYGGHKEAIVTLLEEGNIFGEPAPRSRGAHRDSAQAASACRVAVVGKAALEQAVQRDPRCALALIVAYAQWVQRQERVMERLVQRDIRPRLAASLLELADRLGKPTEGGYTKRSPTWPFPHAWASPRRWPVFGARASSSPEGGAGSSWLTGLG
jgi:CRP/FNR family transcriptional regulator